MESESPVDCRVAATDDQDPLVVKSTQLRHEVVNAPPLESLNIFDIEFFGCEGTHAYGNDHSSAGMTPFIGLDGKNLIHPWTDFLNGFTEACRYRKLKGLLFELRDEIFRSHLRKPRNVVNVLFGVEGR